jgi:hypothetical protein
VAAEQIATEVIRDGERVAVDAVSHEELAFEVDGPDLIGRKGGGYGGAWMLPTISPSSRMNPTMAFENVEDGAACRHPESWVAISQALADLPGAPPKPAVLIQDELNHQI